jgi:hypothetical protein
VRKYLAVLFGVLFILSFSATAFAIHEEMPPEEAVVAQGPAKITLGGKIIVRGWYFDNIDQNALPQEPKGPGAGSPSEAIYTYNAYLTVNAKIGDNLQGFMELETSNNDGNNSGVLYPGIGKAGGAEGTYDTKPNGDLRFRQLWIMYTGSGLTGAPLGIKVGHMPISLGEKQFLNNERFGDDAILVWLDPTKEMHIVAGAVKLVEQANGNPNIGFINHTDDLDGYVLLATYMLDKDNTIGANWTLAHTDGNIPSIANIDSEGVVTPIIPNCDRANLHNLEVHAHGNVAGLTYALEGDWQFGKISALLNDDNDNPKFQGYAAFLKLGYVLDPVNLRASAALGSGEGSGRGIANAGNINEFQALQGTDQTGAISRFAHYTLIYERLVRTTAAEAALTTNPGGNVRTTGIANTTYLNLGFDVNPVKELGLSLDGYYLRATRVGYWKDLLEAAGGSGGVSKNAGWELDAKLNYKIAKNLTYFVEGGIFWPGKFYKEAPLDLDASGLQVPVDKKTVGMAVHGLLLEF